jgi:hypothetical protein
MIQHVCVCVCVCVCFGLGARCKASIVFSSCDTGVVYSYPTWGAELLFGFFLCDNLDRWRPCEPADPLSKEFYPLAVKKIQIPGKLENLAHIGLWY